MLTQNSWISIGTNVPNEIGDAIGGTLGPIVALLASALTFLAFWVQYKANQQQRYDLKIERFENKFYELLQLHRANTDEMNIADRVVGRKCFVQMFNELRYSFMITMDQYKASSEAEKKTYDDAKIDFLRFAYTIFFSGTGINSEKQYVSSFNDAERKLYIDCKAAMVRFQEDYSTAKKKNPDSRYFTFDLPLSQTADERTKVFYYFPFNGHGNRLGHYYRHLYQTVRYVVEQNESLLNFDQKYSYIKTLRAQLSNYEQLMLYYNALAWYKDEWHLFFTDFRLIKNLPLGLAHIGTHPEILYSEDIKRLRTKGIEMFELHE